MIDNEKAIKDPERSGGNSEQIHRCDHLFVISQKCDPAFELVWIGGLKRPVPRHRGLGDLEAEFLQLAMDAWRSPPITRHLDDEFAESPLDPRASSCRCVGYLGPVSAEPSAVPINHSLGFHDDQAAGPSRPPRAEGDPEAAVAVVEYRLWPLTREGRDLLPQGQVLEDQISPRPRQGANSQQHELDQEEDGALLHLAIFGIAAGGVTGRTARC